MKPTQRALLYATILGLLLVVSSLYPQPDFLRDVADQVWACF